MKLQLFQKKDIEEASIHLYYRELTPTLEKIIALVKDEQPCLYGIEDGDKIFIDIDEILYFDTVDKRTYAYLPKKVYQIHYNLATLEEDLKGYGFIRINKSNVVNIYKINSIKPSPNMRVMAVLENKEHLIINRSYKNKFENYLMTMRGVKK